MDDWSRYLFASQSESTLREWAARLRFFRFFRAYGGHANDGDSLDAAFRWRSPRELKDFCAAIGLRLRVHAVEPGALPLGVPLRIDMLMRGASIIPGTRWIEQPGHVTIAGRKAFVWCDAGSIRLSVASELEVTESDVEAAVAIERVIPPARLEAIDPPVDTKHYVCPKYYPDFFVG